MNNILKTNTYKDSKYFAIFGEKISDKCFNFGLSEKRYLEFLRYIKGNEEWKLMSKKNLKIFYYYDLKLIANEEGNLELEKDIINFYSDILNDDNKGIRIFNYNKKKLNVDIFPGLDKIHDIRKVREIIFKKNDIEIKFMVVNHSKKEITFEAYIYSNGKSLLNIMPEFYNIFHLDKLNNITTHKVENLDNMSISIV